MKKALALVLVLVMALALVACQPAAAPSAAPAPDATSAPADEPTPAPAAITKVGISMPTMNLERWPRDAAAMEKALKANNVEVDLQFAGDNDIPTQVSQIEAMINGGCGALVICPIDGSALIEVLKTAKEKNIVVVSYDRMIENTDAVSYYVSFANEKVGAMQGQYLVDKLDLENQAGPFNIELFAGDPGDANAPAFFTRGALPVLQPYIDSGKLVVKSGMADFDKCAIKGWSTEEAQKRMENLVASQGYGPKGTPLAAVLSSNDSMAQGIANALSAAGFKAGENFPIITGQDCDKPAVKNMILGLQAMSIFKDTRTLASKVVEMVNSIVKGEKVDVNDTKTYDNGMGVVPSYLCEPVFATIDNYKELLIDSGYYAEADLKI